MVHCTGSYIYGQGLNLLTVVWPVKLYEWLVYGHVVRYGFQNILTIASHTWENIYGPIVPIWVPRPEGIFCPHDTFDIFSVPQRCIRAFHGCDVLYTIHVSIQGTETGGKLKAFQSTTTV